MHCYNYRLGIFKYISCYCLSNRAFAGIFWESIQIHLMLLFIHNFSGSATNFQIFKYISCYCLSSAQRTLTAWNRYSNTSHVIVYRFRKKIQRSEQHNSNTSHVIVYLVRIYSGRIPSRIQIHLMLLFIHISRRIEPNTINSNTSHVIVYPPPTLHHLSALLIQIHLMLLFILNAGIVFPAGAKIQIHLMLLFIAWPCQAGLDVDLFKYISCYCLSKLRLQSRKTFYIQIHLMLLFIDRSTSSPMPDSDSNTSHVIVYRLTEKNMS